MNRPLLWTAVALLAGTGVAAANIFDGSVLFTGIGLAGFLLLFASGQSNRILVPGLTLVFFAAGALLWNARHLEPPTDSVNQFAHQNRDTTVILEGYAERPDTYLTAAPYLRFILRADRVIKNDKSISLEGGVLVYWKTPDFPVYHGDRVRIVGELNPELSRVNPDTPSYEDYLRRRGIHTGMKIYGDQNITALSSGSRWSLFYWASRLRGFEAKILEQSIPPQSLPFVLTVWLGERKLLTNETYTQFLQSGTAHILAVSGVHVGIIYLTFAYLMRLLLPSYRNRRLRVFLVMAAVVLFALMTGARVSSVRAATMIGLYLLAELFDREPDATNSLSVSAIFFLLHDSDVHFDAGFILSFLSIASILIFRKPISERISLLPNWARLPLATSLSVQILSLPMAVSLFFVLPLVGPLLNLLIIPLLSIILWICLLTSLAGIVSIPVAELIGNSIMPLERLLSLCIEYVASSDLAYIHLVRPTPTAIALYWSCTGAFYLALKASKHRRRWFVVALCLLVSAGISWRPFQQPAEVTLLDVGQGDATFIRTPGGTTVLVDAGDRTKHNDQGRRTVAPFLWANHESSIDIVIATHPDRDHIGGLLYILNNFDVGAVYLNPIISNAPMEQDLVRVCEQKGIPVHRVGRGESLPVAGAQIAVVHPAKDVSDFTSDNDRSVTLHVTWPGMDVLLTGDIQAKAESELAATECQATVLKIPHHGSKSSSTHEFIDAVAPAYAVVSAGTRKDVLKESILDRYRERNIPIFRTDRQGGIRLRVENETLLIESARGMRGYLLSKTLLDPPSEGD